MNSKTVAMYTLGCKVNTYETNKMVQLFKDAGYKIVDFETKADIYVVNTCTVTNMSDRKSRQMFRRARELNSNAVLCVVGCYAQVASEELKKIDEIDIVLGTNDRCNIVKYVEEFLKNKNKIEEVTDIMSQRKYVEWGSVAYTDKARAEIKVQDGCDRYCSYCLIPYARGPVRSRAIDEVYNEVLKIAQTGIKEIVITGIHISSYGKDLNPKIKLINLLEKIHEVEGIERIRLGSLEPLIIDEEFVESLKKLPKICNHFHLSLQSGCDETLQRMNRRYTTDEFKKIVSILRNNIPEVALTTDIIVGFPGETDEEFKKTYEFLKEVKFSKMHIFKYSPRKGTKAAEFENQIDGKIKNIRSDKLIALSNKNEEDFAKIYIGKTIEVLFENETEGHTKNYIKVESKTKIKDAPLIKNVVPFEYKNGVLYV